MFYAILPQKSRELKLQISTRKLTNRMLHWLLKVLPESDLNKMTLSSYYLISFYSIKITQIYNQMFKTYSCVTHTHTSLHLPSKKKSKEKPTSCLRPAINPIYCRYNSYVHYMPQQNHSMMPTGPLRKFSPKSLERSFKRKQGLQSARR